MIVNRIIRWLVVPFALILVGAIGASYALIDTIKSANDNVNWFDPTTGIDESYLVEIGGVKQFLQIRGQDKANPVILFLHGGPGQPSRGITYQSSRLWAEYFTLVEWDQRGTGASESDMEVLGDSINMPQMIDDTIDVIEHIKTRLDVEKVILAGHSWGTVLGINVVKERPDLIYAYVAFAHGVGFAKKSHLVLEEAKKRNDQEGIDEMTYLLNNWPEKSDYDGFVSSIYKTNHYGKKYAGSIHAVKNPDEYVTSVMLRVATSPDVSIFEFIGSVKNSVETYKPLIEYLYDFELGEELGYEFDVPLFFFKGTNELSAPQVEEWVNSLSAPSIRYIEFKRSAHLLFDEEPGKIFVSLVNEVRPLAMPE